MVIGSFVFGFDEDDYSIFDRTLNFLESANLDFAQFSILASPSGDRSFQALTAEERIFLMIGENMILPM